MSSGDYWYDADNGNKPYRYNGSSWVLVQDEDISTAISDAAAAQATADGKMTVFTSGPAAPTAEGVGDLWVYGGVIRKWSGSSWDYEADSTSTALNAEVTTTGGVVLSTNGAIRTAGKSSINDGSAGVLLGDALGLLSRRCADDVDAELAIGCRSREQNLPRLMLPLHPAEVLI